MSIVAYLGLAALKAARQGYDSYEAQSGAQRETGGCTPCAANARKLAAKAHVAAIAGRNAPAPAAPRPTPRVRRTGAR